MDEHRNYENLSIGSHADLANRIIRLSQNVMNIATDVLRNSLQRNTERRENTYHSNIFGPESNVASPEPILTKTYIKQISIVMTPYE